MTTGLKWVSSRLCADPSENLQSQMDTHLQFDLPHFLVLIKDSSTTCGRSLPQHAHESLTRLDTPRTSPSYVPTHTDLLLTPFSFVPHLHNVFWGWFVVARQDLCQTFCSLFVWHPAMPILTTASQHSWLPGIFDVFGLVSPIWRLVSISFHLLIRRTAA